MGTVYRAIDTSLGREVAIKVLPDAFASDPDRQARFEREARTLAALNHPCIAAVYGTVEVPGDAGHNTRAIVMELVEGVTLAERIAQGALPLDDALSIARQIAEALEAAHDHGVIHRDLKPANVKVRDDGTVKVLDFGLAKLVDPGGAPPQSSLSPTITSPAVTAAGVILGTAAYMSPEQARGKAVDRRTDIWSFGCVVFEMLSGRRPFAAGDTVSDAIAAILTGEVVWTALPSQTPATVRRLLERCLRKDVRRRLSHIAEARIALEEIAQDPELEPAPARRAVPWPVVALVALAALGLGAAAAAWALRAPLTAPITTRFDIRAPAGARTLGNLLRPMEIGDPISPDGRTVAFLAAVAGPTMIWVRPLDASTARALPSTEGAGRPFWSPDSRSLAFFAGSQLKRIALAGGLPTVLTDEPGRDVAWSADGVMLIGGGDRPLRRLPASGGVPTPVTALAPGEITHDYPQFLPDGQHFVYLSRRGPTLEDWEMFVGSLDSKERHRLDGIHGAVRYSVTGHLMFTQGETLMAQPFNLERLALDGDPEPVADGVAAAPRPLFGVSTNRTLVYLRASPKLDSQLAWIDRAGRTVTPFSTAGEYSRIALSDDGRYVAFERNLDVMTLDIARNLTSNLIVRAGADIAPVFSPDGTRIAFAGSAMRSFALNNPNNGDLYLRTLGTTEREILLYSDEVGKTPTDWSGDGYVAYTSRNDIWAVQTSPNSTPVRVTSTGFVESAAHFSPMVDGSRINPPTRQPAPTSTCNRFQTARAAIPSPPEAGLRHAGANVATSCSISLLI